MLRLYSVESADATEVNFSTAEIPYSSYMPYVVYDTSSGLTTLEDYYSWRSTTTVNAVTSEGEFSIINSNLYPRTSSTIADYTILNTKLFSVLTFVEHYVLTCVLDRLDLVRKRLPNPGAIIEDVDGIGNGGVVSVAGGYDKKFSVPELTRFIEGALIEINIHPPATNFYWSFTTAAQETVTNPYARESATGIPYKFVDLIVQGAVIRALMAWGILEIDLNFITSDSGLQITYDKVNHVSNYMDRILNEYKSQKEFIKYDCVNSSGVGVGSMPFAAMGIWGYAMNMIQNSGVVPLSSMLGFNIRSNVPL